jgi:hypothetical protein
MEITQENANKLLKELENDLDIFDNYTEFYSTFIEKYVHDMKGGLISDISSFKHDAKIVFYLVYKSFQYILGEMEKEIDSFSEEDGLNEDDETEYNKFKEMVVDSKYIYDNIDSIENNELDSTLKHKIVNVSLYFEKKNKELQEINQTMNDLNNSLERLTTALENHVNVESTN